MSYDESEENVITDSNGNTVSIYYQGEKVYHEFYQCYNCGWTGEITDHGRSLETCPECGDSRHHNGLSIENYEDGSWVELKEG